MAVIAVVQQLEEKSGKREGKNITKVRLGGFCDWKKKRRKRK